MGLWVDCLGVYQATMETMTASPPSPCIAICQMSPKTGLCIGCHRTINEIADWSALTDDEKRAVLERVDERALGAR
jgi:predicted Fe-S protein YdhL (DUF1289 family)